MNKVLVEKYYNRLKTYHLGKENGISRETLASYMNVSLRTQKKVLYEINFNPMYKGLVSTSKSIYICKTPQEAQETIDNTFKSAITLIKKAHAMIKKMGLQNQYNIDKKVYDLFEVEE